MELSPGIVVANRFRLERLLGQGGMGAVWLAQHIALDVPCAVKFIHAESAANPEVRQRFEREAKAAAQLRSANVVQILDYGVCESTPYIAMEYLSGESLAERLQRRQRLEAHETYHIIAQVGRALAKAHEKGVVHRDLKPENIFLVAEDPEIAKVLDFGVAKRTTAIGDSSTRTGALLGTPYFMSPEQAQGIRAVDHRSDLWSLAVVTFRCMTGELPFRSEALGDLLMKIMTFPIPVPSHVAGGVPAGFDAWWQRASQREPAYRFQSAKELVETLGVALGVTFVPMGTTPMPSQLGPGQTAGGAVAAGPAAWPGPATAPSMTAAMSGDAGQGPPTAPFPVADPYSYVAMGTPPGAPASPLGQTGSTASVGGVFTARHDAHKTTRLALIGVLSACVVVGGFGAFLLIRGPSLRRAAAPPPGTASSLPAAGSSAPAASVVATAGSAGPAEATAGASAGTALPPATASAAAAGSAGVATPPGPSATAKPAATAQTPRPQPTSKTPAKPKPKSKPTKPDFGF
ncbi:MAG: serine/threonine protein kinase [Deltaproteobacteria bacterium]|nr:serine/threonine protein kinase [Deltaproteobacteria bacterium]